jgi:hypothetical protein
LTKVGFFAMPTTFFNKNKNILSLMSVGSMRGFRKIITEMKHDDSRAAHLAVAAMLVVSVLYASVIA